MTRRGTQSRRFFVLLTVLLVSALTTANALAQNVKVGFVNVAKVLDESPRRRKQENA